MHYSLTEIEYKKFLGAKISEKMLPRFVNIDVDSIFGYFFQNGNKERFFVIKSKES